MTPMLGFYLCFLILALMVAYAGVEGTMRVFVYLDLQLRYAWIRFRMFLMARKLKSQLIRQTADYTKTIEEFNK